MLHVMKSELYKATHRYYLYITVAALCLMEALFIALIWRFGRYISPNAEGGVMVFSFGTRLFAIVGLLMIWFEDAIFADGYKHQTTKNVLAYGIRRSQFYFGNLLGEFLAGLVSIFVCSVVYTMAVFLVYGTDGIVMEAGILFWKKLCIAIPLWFGALAMANACAFIFKNSIAVGISFAAIYYFPSALRAPMTFFFPPYETVYQWTVAGNLELLAQGSLSVALALRCLTVGVLTAAMISILGLAVFRRKEI